MGLIRVQGSSWTLKCFWDLTFFLFILAELHILTGHHFSVYNSLVKLYLHLAILQPTVNYQSLIQKWSSPPFCCLLPQSDILFSTTTHYDRVDVMIYWKIYITKSPLFDTGKYLMYLSQPFIEKWPSKICYRICSNEHNTWKRKYFFQKVAVHRKPGTPIWLKA